MSTNIIIYLKYYKEQDAHTEIRTAEKVMSFSLLEERVEHVPLGCLYRNGW